MSISFKTFRALSIACLLGAPVWALAGGNAANGESLVTEKGCVACHGVDGNSPEGPNPILAGQYESYLVQALKQYQSGERQNAIMGGLASTLSEQDIEDLAAWFASQESKLHFVED